MALIPLTIRLEGMTTMSTVIVAAASNLEIFILAPIVLCIAHVDKHAKDHDLAISTKPC